MAAQEHKYRRNIAKNINNNTINSNNTTIVPRCVNLIVIDQTIWATLCCLIFEVFLPKLSILMDSCRETATLSQWTGMVTNAPLQLVCQSDCVSGSLPSTRLAPLHHRLCTLLPPSMTTTSKEQKICKTRLGRLRSNRKDPRWGTGSLPWIWRIFNMWNI